MSKVVNDFEDKTIEIRLEIKAAINHVRMENKELKRNCTGSSGQIYEI